MAGASASPSLVIGGRLGFAGTVAASTTVEPPAANRRAVRASLQAVSTAGEEYLDDLYTTYVFTPVVSVSAGYRFF